MGSRICREIACHAPDGGETHPPAVFGSLWAAAVFCLANRLVFSRAAARFSDLPWTKRLPKRRLEGVSTKSISANCKTSASERNGPRSSLFLDRDGNLSATVVRAATAEAGEKADRVAPRVASRVATDVHFSDRVGKGPERWLPDRGPDVRAADRVKPASRLATSAGAVHRNVKVVANADGQDRAPSRITGLT